MIQRVALLRELQLPSAHYLHRSNPLPQSLLDAAHVCLLPDHLTYQSLQRASSQQASPSTSSPVSKFQGSQGALSQSGVGRTGLDHAATGNTAGLPAGAVEVCGSAALGSEGDSEGRSEGVSGGLGGCPVGVQLAAAHALICQLQSKLVGLGGASAASDRAAASDAGCGAAERMALEYRAGQREIAEAALSGKLHNF